MESNTIKEGAYQGYLWYSDQQQPIIFPYDKEEKLQGYNLTKDGLLVCLSLDDDTNPFIIEGQLYDENNGISYSIKYVDGKYLKKEYHVVSKEEGCEVTKKSYMSNRMNGRVLYFKEIWRPSEPDTLCEGMSVLQPAELMFVGFKKAEEKK